MRKKIIYYFNICYNIVRFGFLKLIYGKSFQIHLPFLISFSTKIDFSKDSFLSIGRGTRVLSNTFIATRSRAVLILGDNVFINRNTIIVARNKIDISDGVTIGPNVCIYDHDHDIYSRGNFVCKDITIKSNVWIGANCTILKGVTIGDNSVISAGCIVSQDIPPNSILIQKRNNVIKLIDNG